MPVFQLPYLAHGILFTERATYLPSVGFCWLLAAALWGLGERAGRRWTVALAAVLLVGYTARSVLRLYDWRDEVGICLEGLAADPGSWYLQGMLGETLLRHNRPAEAAGALREAIRIRQDYTDAHNYLGQAYWLLHQPEAALRHYRRAAELAVATGRPHSSSRAWNNIGIVYRSLDRTDEAIQAYRHALAWDPAFSAARNNLGYALLLKRRVGEAIEQLRVTVAQDPALAQAYANLGLAYAMAGQWDQALAALSRAERLSPDNPEVQARIGEIHLVRGQVESARRRFLRALQLQPHNARARGGMAALEALSRPAPEVRR